MRLLLTLLLVAGCCEMASAQSVPTLQELDDRQTATEAQVFDLTARVTALEAKCDVQTYDTNPDALGAKYSPPDLDDSESVSTQLAASIVRDLLTASLNSRLTQSTLPTVSTAPVVSDRLISSKIIQVGDPIVTSVGTPTITRTVMPSYTQGGFVSSSVSGVCTNPNCTDPNCPNRLSLSSGYNSFFPTRVSSSRTNTTVSNNGKWICGPNGCRLARRYR